MKTLTKRELSRNPAKISTLKPGESVSIADRQGGLVLHREKKVSVSPEQMESELRRICADGPKTDVLKMMEEES